MSFHSKVQTQPQGALYSRITSSSSIKTGTGLVHGFVVSAHTSGTVRLWDNTTGSGTSIINTISIPSGPYVFTFPEPVQFSTGLFATLGGTIDITIIYE